MSGYDMPKYNKEQVLAWYQNLKPVLMEAGINMENKGDLMRVKACYVDDKTDDVVEVYAFSSRRHSAEFGGMAEYVTPPPTCSKEQQDMLAEKRSAYQSAQVKIAKYSADIKEQCKKRAGFEQVKNTQEMFKAQQGKAEEEFQKMVEYGNEAFAEYNKWVINGQTEFKPELEYDQIEELYGLAKTGALYISYIDNDPDAHKQILVSNDNKAVISNTNYEMKPIEEPKEYLNFLKFNPDELKKEEERLNRKINVEKDCKKKEPKQPAKVKAPGFVSWLKKVFLRDRTDYTNFERYQSDLATYNTQIEEYRAEKAEVEAYNQQCLKEAEEILTADAKEMYPEGVENPLALAKMSRDASRILHVQDTEPEKGIFNEDYPVSLLRNETRLALELKENPQSYDLEGNVDVKASQEFWKKHGQIRTKQEAQGLAKDLARIEKAKKEYVEAMKGGNINEKSEPEVTKVAEEVKNEGPKL